MTTRFIQADSLDQRVDDVTGWEQSSLMSPAVQVIDIGVSAEELLTGSAGEQWLTGPEASASQTVLVVPTAVTSIARCEAVLASWADRSWAPIDQVVAIGAALTPAAPVGPLLSQALQVARPVPHLQQLWAHGLPPVQARDEASVQPWIKAGQGALAALTGRQTEPRKKHRRWSRRP